MRIEFFAPMKPPSHPTPSGDRLMARQQMAVLEMLGHDVAIASETRFFDRNGDPKLQAAFNHNGRQEADALVTSIRAGHHPRPDLWFTYHLYYKAVDWLGPCVARDLGIPYVVSEASHAPKRLTGPWAGPAARVADILSLADAVLSMTPTDRQCLEPLVPAHRLYDLPPFVDLSGWPAPPDRSHRVGPPVILSVAMMRTGDKLESYRRLANALKNIIDLDWRLHIAGDGPAREDVTQLFNSLSDRVNFIGAVNPDNMANTYASADIFAWPGAGEAYGMAYLEAQAMGLPVAAQAIRGVPAVVQSGHTGLLTPEGDDNAYQDALRMLITDRGRRLELGAAASTFVRRERSPQAAAKILSTVLVDVERRR